MSSPTPDRYAVIGFPIRHSWSPFIHGLFAKQTNQSLTYSRLEVAPENLERDVNEFFESGGKGLNVTVPHKQAVALLARFRTPRAEIAGAVNTLAMQEEGLLGDNTDGAGLLTDLTHNLSLNVENARILLLGAGGAARGVLGPLLGAAPEYIEIANRNGDRATQLAHEFRLLGEVKGCGFDAISTTGTFDLILNATSASLQDTIPPIPPAVIGPTTLCYDMAYGKGDTAFTRWAKNAGAGRAETGWGMLVEQAAESFYLWRGVKPETKPVLEAVKSQK
ncbi:MAG TPA: shikimate dehydrogenase [Povalibacter sp.]|uniref:shikimate dehydrogenase n=1 Tax=Povalibacter sp. TaxID=1962978 RepID=UPI002C6F7F87|nr:shikimate dehydrogenase [Povalibacter sp.]HMN45199.1 shikimate dehydrogenase [Povalibacter sp.]